LSGIGVLESVPPGVGGAEKGASNLIPVRLGVCSGWDGEILGRTADRPSSLSNPNRLSSNSGLSGVEGR
jgi:hypothetical protein